MNRYLTFILIGTLLMCFGCESHKIQNPTSILLMDVKSTNCSLANGYLKYENDTIRVVYVFWEEKGIMGLLIHNKLSKPLYIDWRKCSFITGTIKHDYWEGTTIIKQASESQGTTAVEMAGQSKGKSESNSFENPFGNSVYSTWSNLFSSKTYSTSYGFNSTTTQIIKPERVTFIPPATTICNYQFELKSNYFFFDKYNSRDTIVYTPKVLHNQLKEVKGMGDNYWKLSDSTVYEPNTEKIYYKTYDSKSSPISFRSFITYSTDENFSKEAYVNSNFYVAEITKISKAIYKSRTYATIGENENYNIWASPNSFFLWQYNE